MSENILIVTSTTMEFDAMSRRLELRRESHDDVITAWGRIGSADVVVAMTGRGQESTSAAVARLVDRTNARYVLLVGVASGFSSGRPGDVVVPTSIQSPGVEHDWAPDWKLVQIATRLAEEETARWKKAVRVARPDGMRDDATAAHAR